jgi:hypothetical protein
MAAQILEIMDSSGATALLIFVSYWTLVLQSVSPHGGHTHFL